MGGWGGAAATAAWASAGGGPAKARSQAMSDASQSAAADTAPMASSDAPAAATSILFKRLWSGLVTSVSTDSIGPTMAAAGSASKAPVATMTRPLLVIAGPTASGKSALALAVGREFAGTIINADSLQVYRELRLLTARPDAAAEAAVPHRLYGVLAAAGRRSARRWGVMAGAEIEAAQPAGPPPVPVRRTRPFLAARVHRLGP